METTKTNCNKIFARFLLLVTVGTGTFGYSDETVFTNNNSITNKLLSVEKFVNNLGAIFFLHTRVLHTTPYV